MFKQWLLALCVSGFALSACAAPDNAAGTPESVVRKAVLSFAPKVTIDSVRPAPFAGFYQVIASGHLVYVSADGKYMLNGDLVDLASRRNVSQDAWAAFRKAELAKLPPGQGIVFAPPNPKYKITVFTDVNCAYCRAFHAHIAEINKEGIAVEYLAWPREGLTTTSGRDTPTYTEMVSVWCAADRKAAFTAAKQGQAPKPASCASPVKDQFNLGVRLGVDGTPTVIAPDGRVLGGFVPPDKLLRLLQDPSAGG